MRVDPAQDLSTPGTAADVKLVVIDVDGVLTDGGISLNTRGCETKRFHVLDGAGILMLQFHGIEVGVLSGRQSEVVGKRAAELKLSFYLDGVLDKDSKLREILDSRSLQPRELCYIGDDIIDIPCLSMSGFPVAVANAHPEVKRIAAYITRREAEEGAVREVAEVILKAHKRWDNVLERYSR